MTVHTRNAIAKWAFIAAGVSAVAVVLRRFRRTAPTDLGFVSEQWVVEHRASRGAEQ
jgi:hypothetical protein